MNINPMELLKNAQAIQNQFQQKLAALEATGSAGGSMVEIDLNGTFELLAVRIAPELLESGDTEMLQDLIIAAYSNAREKIRETQNREIGSLAGSMGLPGFMGAS